MPTTTRQKQDPTLQRFGLVTEAEVADLLGITVASLRHRPRDTLPASFKSGRRRLFKEDDVRAFIERNIKSAA